LGAFCCTESQPWGVLAVTIRIDPRQQKQESTLAPVEVSPVAVLYSPFRERFGIPRQPGLVPDVPGRLVLLPPYDRAESVAGLEDFSHVWLLFRFHANPASGPALTVRPPRLGGNERVGVFASRSPYRPNSIGLSVARLEAVEQTPQGPVLRLRGVDLLDGTPVLDVKPYVPYADALPEARGGFAAGDIARLPVRFLADADRRLRERSDRDEVRAVIEAVLALDPRPGYRQGVPDSSRSLGMRLYDFDLRWRVRQGVAEVLDLAPVGGVAEQG
jgi:tRNA-Thr(GGU) m(6)t(6)A37 methyltransferase TsaA